MRLDISSLPMPRRSAFACWSRVFPPPTGRSTGGRSRARAPARAKAPADAAAELPQLVVVVFAELFERNFGVADGERRIAAEAAENVANPQIAKLMTKKPMTAAITALPSQVDEAL